MNRSSRIRRFSVCSGASSSSNCSTLAEVQAWFAENGVEYVRAYPSAILGQESESEELFASVPDNWRVEGWVAQLGWMSSLGHEGWLFVTVGRRF